MNKTIILKQFTWAGCWKRNPVNPMHLTVGWPENQELRSVVHQSHRRPVSHSE